MKKIIGPFTQLLTMDNLPLKGVLKDEQLKIISNAAVLISNDKIDTVGVFDELIKYNPTAIVEETTGTKVALPGFIDCHTHICFAGSRARDYATRNNGKSYQERAAEGGGIWDTVIKTRRASQKELEQATLHRLNILLSRGITTAEVKSGYGLSQTEELKLLRAIKVAGKNSVCDILPTCLAAHIIPQEFTNESDYLGFIFNNLVPEVRKEKLTNRFDIFIEQNAFTPSKSVNFLKSIKQLGFDLTVHGDQFTTGGSKLAIEVGAVSVDHLEACGREEIKALSRNKTIPVVLPGASIGLGIPFAPARKLLDAGCALAIASDWNPGSAPNGNLLTQSALLGAYEKLSATEVFAGITYRAANALNLQDRGALKKGMLADMVVFDCDNYQEILYHQGELQPSEVWKNGSVIIQSIPTTDED